MSNEKIDKRGYAYECLVCKQYKVEKRNEEAHIYKKHLHPTGVPFYCKLCNFMTRTERNLLRHAKGYKPHKEALEEMDKKGEVSPSPKKMYVRNPKPRSIDDTLIRKLPVEESKRV